MSEFENNLISLYQTFFLYNTYQETLKMPLAAQHLSFLPEVLQTVYRTIGNVPELMKSEFGYYYSIDNVKINSWQFQCSKYDGFMFGSFDGFCYHLYPQVPTWENGIADSVTLWNNNHEFEMWSEFSTVEAELLYLSVNNAIWNSDYVCNVTSRKLLKDYYSILCNEYNLTPFSDGHEQSWMLYSEADHILVRFGDYDHNRLLIASNSLESIEKISRKYKMKWLKKGGQKEDVPITAMSDSAILTTSERLNAIYEICCGKKQADNLNQKFIQIEEQLQLTLPDSLKQYHQLFHKLPLMMESCCSVVPLSKLTLATNMKVKVASCFEGDGVCYYYSTDQMIHVEYENDDTLILKTEEFIIMLALYQAAYIMKSNGLLSNNQIPSQLYQITIDKRIWIISKNYKLLGIPFNDSQCLLFAKHSSDLIVAEKKLHLSLSPLW